MQLLPAAAYQPALIARSAVVLERLQGWFPAARPEHVGASALPGALSKGDLDLVLLVPADEHAEVVAHLLKAGYEVQQDTLRTPQLCMLNGRDEGGVHAVQVVAAGSRFEAVFIGFRDALRASPALVQQYNAVKQAAAPQGMAAYRAAKQVFIERVLAVQPAGAAFRSPAG